MLIGLTQLRKNINYFNVFFIKLGSSEYAHQSIYSCPWCSKRLPGSLHNTFFTYLKSMGFEVDVFEQEKIPEEFKIGECWRNRNLHNFEENI
jgi:hypothetical protein